jgi:Glycosyl hydrolase family 26
MGAHRRRDRKRRGPVSVALVLALAAVMSGPAPQAGARPRDPRSAAVKRALRIDGQDRVFGLSAPGQDRGLAAASATADGLGHGLGVLNFFEAWSLFQPLPVDSLRQIVARGALPEITWEPWAPSRDHHEPDYATARIASGAFDSYIDWWAHDAAAYGAPLLLRFAHEMNGTSYPWSPAVNGDNPAAYVAAWRHVHDRFVAAGATNVIWVWSPNIVTGQPTPLSSVFPGNNYVDVAAVDGYNYGAEEPTWGGWNRPRRLFADTIRQVEQLAPNKPLWINETGSSEHGGDKAQWIGELFDYLRTTRATGLVWFDLAVPGQPDFRLNSSPASFAAASAGLQGW